MPDDVSDRGPPGGGIKAAESTPAVDSDPRGRVALPFLDDRKKPTGNPWSQVACRGIRFRRRCPVVGLPCVARHGCPTMRNILQHLFFAWCSVAVAFRYPCKKGRLR